MSPLLRLVVAQLVLNRHCALRRRRPAAIVRVREERGLDDDASLASPLLIATARAVQKTLTARCVVPRELAANGIERVTDDRVLQLFLDELLVWALLDSSPRAEALA